MRFLQYSKEFAKKFFALIEKAQEVVITAHKSPDDDSISSVLALRFLLTHKYPDKKIRIVYTGEKYSKFASLMNFDKIEFVEDLVENIKTADLIIGVDGNEYGRFTYKPEELKKKKVICLDHHVSEPDEFELLLWVKEATSCAEIMYEIIKNEIKINQELAKILLVGIIGDTGNFKFVKEYQTNIFLITKELLDIAKIDIQGFKADYEQISKTVFEIVKELINNTKYGSVKGWPDFSYSFVTKESCLKNNYSVSQVKEAVSLYVFDYLRLIESYKWGFVVSPEKNFENFSISMRSLPESVNVQDMAKRMGIGGGHDRAAGGTFSGEKYKEVNNCIDELLRWISSNAPVLSK